MHYPAYSFEVLIMTCPLLAKGIDVLIYMRDILFLEWFVCLVYPDS